MAHPRLSERVSDQPEVIGSFPLEEMIQGGQIIEVHSQHTNGRPGHNPVPVRVGYLYALPGGLVTWCHGEGAANMQQIDTQDTETAVLMGHMPIAVVLHGGMLELVKTDDAPLNLFSQLSDPSPFEANGIRTHARELRQLEIHRRRQARLDAQANDEQPLLKTTRGKVAAAVVLVLGFAAAVSQIGCADVGDSNPTEDVD